MQRWLLLAVLATGISMLAPKGAVQAATFLVKSTADGADANTADGLCDDGSGACTLRAAIQQANASAGMDSIGFDLSPPHRIQPTFGLPAVTDAVIIDGTTEADYAGTPIVELNGGAIPFQGPNGLHITSGDSTVRGMIINRFSTGAGIKLETNGNNLIEGNYIGTNAAGTAAFGNGDGVLLLQSPGNTIGGTDSSKRNVISGNVQEGIDIQLGSSGTRVIGNYVGIDVTGTSALGNSGDGGVRVMTSSNTIGGTTSGVRNVISGNPYGVWINVSPNSGNVVQGNLIGTNPAGTLAIPNSIGGILITGPTGTVIGGTAPGAGNVISGNGGYGIQVSGQASSIQGNSIGTDITGLAPLGNGGNGVNLLSADSTIGGSAAGANTVAFNSGHGVSVSGASATGNRIRWNSIHANIGNGIDTENGGNQDLSPPTISTEDPIAGTACPSCIIDVYSDDANEGRTHHGFIVADGNGIWSFSDPVTGPHVTATATNAGGNTSEFSAAFACTDADSDQMCNSADTDDDNDRWSDTAEGLVGTDPLDACGPDAWPPDINNDSYSDITDLGAVAGSFGKPVGPPPNAPARKDIAPDPPDGFVDVSDIGAVAGLFGTGCAQ